MPLARSADGDQDMNSLTEPAPLELTRMLESAGAEALSGLLTVTGQRGEALLYFKKGHLTLLAYGGRPTLMEALVAGRAITQDDLERARDERRGSRRSLADVLVESGFMERDALHTLAAERLYQDACEALASPSSLEFEDVKVPRNVFDPEERRLELSIPCSELDAGVVQCAEKWKALRETLPSDNAHCVLAKELEVDDDRELAVELIEELYGTRSIAEVMGSFPTRRLEAYSLLAELVEDRNVRFAGPLELARLAESRMTDDPDGAWALVSEGLSQRPRHRELLTVRARLAELKGDLSSATEAFVGLAHLAEEAGEKESAQEFMRHAKRVAPDDYAVWERSFHLTLSAGREEAIGDGERLAALYRQHNRHGDAHAVFATLLENGYNAWRVHRGLARTRAASGEVRAALRELTTYARESILRGEGVNARLAYEELLDFDPDNSAAHLALEELDRTRHEERRKPRRRRAGVYAATAGLLVVLGVREAFASAAFRVAQRVVDQAHLIEKRNYEEAIERFEAVLDAHPFTPTAIDVRSRIESLRKSVK
jgi:tetratricopeptide (TPR) repeat protein